jgi:hypothetical protein
MELDDFNKFVNYEFLLDDFSFLQLDDFMELEIRRFHSTSKIHNRKSFFSLSEDNLTIHLG